MMYKTTSVVTQIGGGTAAASGATYIFGFTPAAWSVVGVVGGLAISGIGLAFNMWIGWRRFQLEQQDRLKKNG